MTVTLEDVKKWRKELAAKKITPQDVQDVRQPKTEGAISRAESRAVGDLVKQGKVNFADGVSEREVLLINQAKKKAFGDLGFEETPEASGFLETLGQSFLGGLKNIGGGVVSAANVLSGDRLVDPEKLEETKELGQLQQQERAEQRPITSMVGEIAGEVVGFPFGGAGKSIGTRLAGATGTGAAAGALSASGRGEDVSDAALFGAILGGSIQGVTEAGKSLFRRHRNFQSGNFSSEDAREVIEAARENNVRLFADDLSESEFIEKIAKRGEEKIFGTARGKAAQEIEQLRAVDDFANSFGAREAVDIVRSVERQKGNLQSIASKLYKKADQELDQLGNVQMNNFQTEFVNTIRELANKRLPNQELINKLAQFQNVSGKATDVAKARQELSELVSNLRGTGAIGTNESRLVDKLKSAMDKDIDNLAANTPGGQKAQAALQKARRFYQNRIAEPFKKSRIKNLIKENDPEGIVSFLTGGKTFGGNPQRAQQLFNSLDRQGRSAVKGALLHRALSLSRELGDGFSAKRFAEEVERIRSSTGVFFKGVEMDKLKGLVKLMTATRTKPGAGSSVLPYGFLVKAMTQGVKGQGADSALIPKLLIGLGKTTEQTVRTEKLIDQLSNIAQKTLIQAKD